MKPRGDIDTDVFSKIASNVLEDTPVLFAYLFGSHIRGDYHRFSDIDIAVFVEGLNPVDRMKLALELSLNFEAFTSFGKEVDVRVINDLPLVVNGEIALHGVLIYQRDESARVDFEKNTRLAYFDFLPVIRNYQNAYLKKESEAERR